MHIHITSVNNNNDSLYLKLVTIQSPIHTFNNHLLLSLYGTSLVAEMVKKLPAMWETWVKSLGWEDPLEKEMATHSSILAMENSMDRGAWWATVHGVTKSWTQLSD